MQWNFFGRIKFIFMAKRGFAIHLINILEYVQITIIKTEAADFENEYLCHSQNFWPQL
ncbi:hypothetical protein AB205_0107260 [Aquarana catesbeiana]|uniref:Uncharacterized protein n=1 Tax=Aquarana catesbeiana TaxID=8400 RepID=A0A2G9RHI7_AQUCT|nr:hypothetical protein AB205_0107260 [Aquarana catesbeiana]